MCQLIWHVIYSSISALTVNMVAAVILVGLCFVVCRNNS